MRFARAIFAGTWFRLVQASARDQFIQLTAVEPYSAAFRTIVDLDPLPFGHHQRRLIYRALHIADYNNAVNGDKRSADDVYFQFFSFLNLFTTISLRIFGRWSMKSFPSQWSVS